MTLKALEKKLNIKPENIIDIYSSAPKKINAEKLNLETTTNIDILNVASTTNTDTLNVAATTNTNIKTFNDKNGLIEELKNEFIRSKEIIQESIEINMMALRGIGDSLRNTPHNSRGYGDLARLLESMTALNQQYLNSSRQYIDIFKSIINTEDEKDEKNFNKFNIQNAIFSGTLQELIRSVSKSKNPI